MTDTMTITIAGAGIGGLAVARALALRGHRVKVAEKAERISEVGAGIQISPNGMVVLKALGLYDAIEAVSIRASAVRLMDGPSGAEVATLDLGRAPDLEWRFIHRARLIDVLLAGAREAGAEIATGVEIAPPPEGRPLSGDDLLIGADGLKSRVRARVDEASKPFFTNQVAWRTIIADDDALPEARVFMGPGRHLVTYPLPGGRRNIVAVEERQAWAEEGWSHQDHPANLRAAFSGFCPEVRAWLDSVEECHVWGLFRHRVADRWWSGRQVVIGDAAHPTLPFLAQGANMALEDAWCLATELETSPVDEALTRFQARRRPRVTRTVDAATANARNYHLKSAPVRLVAHTGLRLLGAVAPGRLLGQFDWLYRHDVTAE